MSKKDVQTLLNKTKTYIMYVNTLQDKQANYKWKLCILKNEANIYSNYFHSFA